ncbi:protein MEI2-like 2 isoform X4 [Iris pallida]|uniref:Protein MEI2-like 2 isoform X4 n=1 Tax=Iris pallida TaxID=29817 RepID=A0AAX6EQM0_IRIPA|nr:protein MEI2-like 2 isoform X4 [Iris pallida]
MISYYDIRAARTAMRALQNKPLRRRKLDIHFSIPKDNPSDKDMNQGTLVVFNLDPSVSNDDLLKIFGVYGEVKEIRETPHKKHKFIEYYDVRAAEAALRSLNRIDIAGKRIKLEPSRPGGAHRNMMQQLTREMEQDDTRSYRHQVGSPITNSPPGSWAQFSISSENNLLQNLSRSPTAGAINPGINHFPGLASSLPSLMSNPVKIAPIGKDQGRVNHADQVFSNGNSSYGVPIQHSQSFPEHENGMISSSPRTVSLLVPQSQMHLVWGPQLDHSFSGIVLLSTQRIPSLLLSGKRLLWDICSHPMVMDRVKGKGYHIQIAMPLYLLHHITIITLDQLHLVFRWRGNMAISPNLLMHFL